MATKQHSAPQAAKEGIQGESGDDAIPVILHPLVVINVSDHFTRFAAMRMFPEASARNAASDPGSAAQALTDGRGATRVMGILLGTQSGRTVEVCHSFELQFKVSENGQTLVDLAFMERRIQQYRQIFAQYNIVGWYCTGSEVTDEDLRLHMDVFSVHNEAPILLVMNPENYASGGNDANNIDVSRASSSDGRQASQSTGVLTTYQMELRVVNAMPKMMLAAVPHRYASEDSERIAVDHVMRHAIPGGADGTSSTTLHLQTVRRSISMLKSRMEVLVDFLEATASGAIDVDHDLLRRVAGVCSRLPAMDCQEFTEAFSSERHDSLVITYLTGVTKSLCAMNEAVDTFNRSTERPSASGGTRRRGIYARA